MIEPDRQADVACVDCDGKLTYRCNCDGTAKVTCDECGRSYDIAIYKSPDEVYFNKILPTLRGATLAVAKGDISEGHQVMVLFPEREVIPITHPAEATKVVTDDAADEIRNHEPAAGFKAGDLAEAAASVAADERELVIAGEELMSGPRQAPDMELGRECIACGEPLVATWDAFSAEPVGKCGCTENWTLTAAEEAKYLKASPDWIPTADSEPPHDDPVTADCLRKMTPEIARLKVTAIVNDLNAADLTQIAKQALCLMVLDLEYSDELRPVYGHVPMRHLLLWGQAKTALGDEFDAEVAELIAEQGRGNEPCKTNPWLSPEPTPEEPAAVIPDGESYLATALADLHRIWAGPLDFSQTPRMKVVAQMVADIRQQRDEAIDALPRWIPVGERLPAEGVEVIASGGTFVFASYYHARFDGVKQWMSERHIVPITHWMPLPELPAAVEPVQVAWMSDGPVEGADWSPGLATPEAGDTVEAAPEPVISKEDFEAAYWRILEMEPQPEMHAIPCDCGLEGCSGWQMVTTKVGEPEKSREDRIRYHCGYPLVPIEHSFNNAVEWVATLQRDIAEMKSGSDWPPELATPERGDTAEINAPDKLTACGECKYYKPGYWNQPTGAKGAFVRDWCRALIQFDHAIGKYVESSALPSEINFDGHCRGFKQKGGEE